MTITAKTTKAEIRDYIEASSKKKAVKANNKLAEVIKKALELDIKKVKREDLVKVANAITKVLSTPASAQTVQAENSTKKISKKAKKEEPKTEEKKASKKSKKSKESSKSELLVPMATAECFPETIEEGGQVFTLAHDIKTMEDLRNALNKDETIVFAYYWSKRHLKQFRYFDGTLGTPKQFPNDLDLATAIYVSDEDKVAYQVSSYTEAMYQTLCNENSEEDGIRISNGIEFQIYRGTEESEED